MMQALVIDDQPVFRRAVSRMLRRLGFEVHEAGDGDQGLARIGALQALDLVMVDWRMPGASGLHVVEQIRCDERYAATRVLMVTALDDVIAANAALVAGANAFMVKPFGEQDLVHRLAQLELPIRAA